MRKSLRWIVVSLAATVPGIAISAPEAERITVDNFRRAESDLYFAKFVADGGFGAFVHERAPVPIEQQDVVRMNRDTLYSYGVADLAAGPVTVTLPDADERFMSLQVINEDHYTPTVVYQPGAHTYTEDDIGTRYVLFLARTLVDPANTDDLGVVHELQDALTIEQGEGAVFEIPDWDVDRAALLREALNNLATANGGINSARMFGPESEVDPVQHLIGTAAGWGGNPQSDAYYSGVTPERNDGKTIYRLTVGKVPVDGFWSISVYNAEGYFEKNALDRYSINDITAEPATDGSIQIQFGGCEKDSSRNCLPTSPGWNYLVRMYRPKPEVLNSAWVFPVAVPVN